jgi:hypothetical protein
MGETGKDNSSGSEHPQSPGESQWNWTPATGEGVDAALEKVRSGERVKRAWRELRPVADTDHRHAEGGPSPD